ncbi:MAG TPA: hypothetical protein PLR99_10535 [Polyangiaceae bacterium]|nr:hypothetical protein [Polyangiaceae bacterium]
MGGSVYFIPLARGPADEATRKALLETTWGVLARRIDSLAKKKGLRDITGAYLAMESSDGIDDGSWFADEWNITLSFGDAAGLCVGEADACYHWAELVTLELWDVLAERVRAHGAELGPKPRALEDALAKNTDPIFYFGTKLAVTTADPTASDDHEFRVFDSVYPLSKVPAADRERVRGLIREGRCACDLCQALRAKLGLPLAPEAARPPKRAKPKVAAGSKGTRAAAPARAEPAFDLATAPVRTALEGKALLASAGEVVILDLAERWFAGKKPSPALRRALPSMPIRALGLYHQRMRDLWPEVYELADLEILSLYDTSLPRGLPADIGRLGKLRAIDLGWNSSSATWDPALFRIPSLEVVLGVGGDEPPPDLLARPLSILDMGAWRRPGPKAARELRLEAAIYPDGLLTSEDVARMPLRFLWTSKIALPEGNPLETLALGGDEPPRWIAGLPALRHLHLSVKRLPDWLPELSGLETLVVHTHRATADALRPLERMSSLRRLGLFAHDTASLPLDLSGLERLELLAISNGPKRWADMPRGIATLPALRRFFTSMLGAGEDAKAKRDVAATVIDGNVLRLWNPFDLYGALSPPGSAARLLARFRNEHWLDDLR